MSDESALPFLSRFDPPETAEGSLDPLGFYVLADGLAVRLAPGVRERQVNLRFLTIALTGMAARAAGGIAEASAKGLPSWLVYEWVIVEALVSQALDERDRNLAQGIPGRDKVQSTLLAGDALALGNYLKTPSVFGFHGVYRVLGLKTGLFHAGGQPSDKGFNLLQAWERDQRLSGFISGTGPGFELRQALIRAVSSGLESESSRLRNRQLIGWIRQHLSHRQVGPEESVALWEALKGDALRSEYLDLLTSPEGQAQWLTADGDQARIHRWMSRHASATLRLLLHAVQSVERFFRLLSDAFDEVRDLLGEARCALPIPKVCQGTAVSRAAEDTPSAYRDAMEALGQIEPNLRQRGELSFSWASEPMSAAAFAASLIAHHERIQRTKPPNGKRSWFDTFADGRIALRAAYVLQEPFSAAPDRYVHPYPALGDAPTVDLITSVVRRFMRTETFLVRFGATTEGTEVAEWVPVQVVMNDVSAVLVQVHTFFKHAARNEDLWVERCIEGEHTAILGLLICAAMDPNCWRRPKFDPPCRLNFDPGLGAGIG